MARSFYPVTFHWRDASGREAVTRLYWAGPLFNAGGANGLLGDPDSQPDPFSALPWLVDPNQNDGVTSYLQACSSAALVGVDGPVPERWLHDQYGYDLERLGSAGVPYGTVQDHLRLTYFVDPQPEITPGVFLNQAPPPSWSFDLPAPVPANFLPGHPNGYLLAETPVAALNSVLLSFTGGGGDRWNHPGNSGVGAWCTSRGVYVTNITALPRLVRRVPGRVSDYTLAPDLSGPAL